MYEISIYMSGSHVYTGRFIMFFAITNIYNKKTKGPTLTFWRRIFFLILGHPVYKM